ncbi:GntR family transcriptional regulator [Cupriavidus sp. D384]|uniref:GntR family transcriptional regulator n=1 Tax=Cupriavidus sp. D384 TaxID=1538095 RepID=UPI00082A67A0|nr:GntR family transcriptional regulator [Cupriavidus sp. D384]
MLTQKIVGSISDAIYHRKLPPGTKLNERDIADLFGVSRTVVRQALIRLSQDGLVDISPKRSSAVWRPTFDDAFELYQMLLVLESGVIDQVVKSITPDQLKALRAHTEKERHAFEKGKHDLGDKLGREFHSLLLSFLNNETLNQIHSQLRRREALINAMFRVGFDYCQLRDEHGKLVACLEKRDAAAAKELLASHYNLVIRGYRFDASAAPDVDLKTALSL